MSSESAVFDELYEILDQARETGRASRARLGRILRESQAARECLETEIVLRKLLAAAPPPTGAPCDDPCPEGEVLEGFVRRELGPEQHRGVLEHLSACGECRWIVTVLLDEAGTLRLPEWVEHELASSCARAAAPARPSWGRWALGTGALAATAAVAVLAIMMLGGPRHVVPSQVAGTEPPPIPVESAPPGVAAEPQPESTPAAVAQPPGAAGLKPAARPKVHLQGAGPGTARKAHPRALPPERPVLAISEGPESGESTVPPLVPPSDPEKMRDLPPARGSVLDTGGDRQGGPQ